MELEPALEGILRSAGLHEAVISAFRVTEIDSRAVFGGLDSSEDGLRATAKQARGIDVENGEFTHKREMAKLLSAWHQAKVMAETKVKLDALARAHGESVSSLPEDWEELLNAFKTKYGRHIHEWKSPTGEGQT